MKRFIKKFSLVLVASLVGFTVSAADIFKGTHYQGIAKIKGQAVDGWVDMTVDDGDLEFDMANSFTFMEEYTVSGQGKNMTMNVKMPGSGVVPLKTTDGGSTLTGSFNRMGQHFDLWLLRIPTKLIASTLPSADLNQIVSSPDGYTAFVTIDLPDGQKMCATSEFVISADDHSYRMICDSPEVQRIFSNMQGSYAINGAELVLKDTAGVTKSGTIYDDGNYIKVPMGSAQGFTLNLILIR